MTTTTNEAPPPLSSTETVIARRWSELLGVEPILATDRFSELGGESLVAEQMLIELSRDLATETSAEMMQGDPTLGELAGRIEDSRATRFRSGPSTTVTLRSGTGPGPSIFAFAGAGATAMCFLPFADQLDPGPAVHAFQARGLTSRGLPDWTLHRAARRHAKEVQRLQPEGPVFLVGHSFGGHIATEAARILLAEGRPLGGLYLLDSYATWASDGSAGDRARAADEQAPGLAQQLRTHVRVATVGLVRYDAATHQELMWEQAIRVQNRMQVRPLPEPATVFVTEEQATQEPAWKPLLGPASKIVRVPGNHNSVINDSSVVRVVTEAVSRDLTATDR